MVIFPPYCPKPKKDKAGNPSHVKAQTSKLCWNTHLDVEIIVQVSANTFISRYWCSFYALETSSSYQPDAALLCLCKGSKDEVAHSYISTWRAREGKHNPRNVFFYPWIVLDKYDWIDLTSKNIHNKQITKDCLKLKEHNFIYMPPPDQLYLKDLFVVLKLLLLSSTHPVPGTLNKRYWLFCVLLPVAAVCCLWYTLSGQWGGGGDCAQVKWYAVLGVLDYCVYSYDCNQKLCKQKYTKSLLSNPVFRTFQGLPSETAIHNRSMLVGLVWAV